MKTNQFLRLGALALISAGLLSVASCEKKGSEELTTQTTLTASMEQGGSNTKTYLDGLDVKWSTSDKIAVFFGTNDYKNLFALQGAGGSATGTFTGSGTNPVAYAFYPYHYCSSIDASQKITFTLPREQTYVENSFGKGANPMVAHRTSAGNLEFKNLCGILKITLTATTSTVIKEIVVSSKTQKLSGKATIETYGATPTFTMDATAINTVTLNTPDVTLSTTPTSFYIVVPPTTFAKNDLTVTIFQRDEADTGAMQKVNSGNAVTISRAQILSMTGFGYSKDANSYVENNVCYGIGVTVSGTIFAPVNCGYEPADGSYKGYPYGKLYQWGRRDGGGYNRTYDQSVQDTEAAEWISGVFQNNGGTPAADMFYTTSVDPDDWYSNTTHLSAWNGSGALSDPCPAGWKVPAKDELEKLKDSDPNYKHTLTSGKHGSTLNLKGFFFPKGETTLFLPAAGLIFGDGRGEGNRGIRAYYWASTVDGVKSYSIYFDDAETFYLGSEGRAHGKSVRCVKI